MKKTTDYEDKVNLRTKEDRLQEKKETGKKRKNKRKRKRVKINPRQTEFRQSVLTTYFYDTHQTARLQRLLKVYLLQVQSLPSVC